MANTIKLRRSAVTGKAPAVGDLQLGELALNTYDGKLYTKKDNGTESIVELSGVLDGAVTDAKVASNAAIAGTKISPNFGSQTVQTTGVISHALGTAGAPTVTFTGDTNTGIYSPGADQVGISTGGTERARIDSSGRLLVGTSSLTAHVRAAFRGNSFGSGVNSTVYMMRDAANPTTGQTLGVIAFTDSNEGIGAEIAVQADAAWGSNDYPGRIVFSTTADGSSSPTERMRITSAGTVGIGTTSPAKNFEVSASTGATIRLNSSSTGIVANDVIGAVEYYANDTSAAGTGIAASIDAIATSAFGQGGALRFSTRTEIDANAVERLRIDSSGRVGIGTTSVQSLLNLKKDANSTAPGDSASIVLTNKNTTLNGGIAGGIFIDCYRDISDPSYTGGIWFTRNSEVGNLSSSSHIVFGTQTSGGTGLPSERARLDSSGRLLLGTSSARTTSTVNWRSQIEGGGELTGLGITSNSNDVNGAYLSLAKSRGTTVGSNTIVQNGDGIGYILFSGADGTDANTQAALIGCVVDGTPGANIMPGRIVLSTTASGASSPTERMRITSAGNVVIGSASGQTTPGLYIKGSTAAAGAYPFQVTNSSNTNIMYFENNTYVYAPGIYNLTTTSAANVFINAAGTMGRVTSSIKYKTDVETLEDSYADALLDLRPVWYRSLSKMDNPDWGYWGFIAEELAEIDPRLVLWKTEEPVFDENGNPQGTVPLDKPEPEGVQYERFVPHLLNLIKRQKEQIEAQGTAIAALEARLSALEAS